MLKIYFDENLIDNKWVRSLKQEGSLFDNQFKLGSTLCRVFELEIDKRSNFETPDKVYIKDDDTLYATLYIDEIDNTNNSYYKFTLTDAMVKLNKEFDYSVSTPHSVKALVETICTNHGFQLVTQSFYMDDLQVSWNQDGMTEREFIGYVAEVNGGYAYFNASGNLVIKKYSSTVQDTIEVEECSSFKLGSYHKIDRVYVELASATKYYPETSNNETCYINSENILLTDSGSYTIDGIIQHIYNDINGFEFYNVKVDRCPIDDDVLCGDIIEFTLGDDSYKTIAQIDYSFSNHWYGGYELDLENAEQQETQIKDSTKKAVREMKIIVDRELGEIKQEIKESEEQFVKTILPLYAQVDAGSEIPNISSFGTTLPSWAQDKDTYVMFKLTYKSDREAYTDKTKLDYPFFMSATPIFNTTSSKTAPSKPEYEVYWDDDKKYEFWNKKYCVGSSEHNYYYFSIQYDLNGDIFEFNTPILICAYNAALIDVTASLSMYVKKNEGSDYISSWINACADNIVLNASSSLVFGDIDNQYITISNYKNSSGTKVGVLFDGTGEIKMETEGALTLQNNSGDTSYNIMLMTMSSTIQTGNKIYFDNRNINALTANELVMASDNYFSPSYSLCNYTRLANKCQPYPSRVANYFNMTSVSDDTTYVTSSQKASNEVQLFNCKQSNGSAANSLSLTSNSTMNSNNLYNYEKNTYYTANYVGMYSNDNYNTFRLSNSQYGINKVGNYLQFQTFNVQNQIHIRNNVVGTDLPANIIQMNNYNGTSGYNTINIQNKNVDENVISNEIRLTKGSKWNDNSICIECSSASNLMAKGLFSTSGVTLLSKDRDSSKTSEGVSLEKINYDNTMHSFRVKSDGIYFDGTKIYLSGGYVRY